MLYLIVGVWVEISVGIVVCKSDIRSGVRAVKERLAAGTLFRIVVVAINCFSQRFWDVYTLAIGVDFANISRKTRTPDASEVVVVVRCASHS